MPNDFGEFTLDTDALDQTIGGALSQIKIWTRDRLRKSLANRTRTQRLCDVERVETVVHFLKYVQNYLVGPTEKVRADHDQSRCPDFEERQTW